MQYYEEENDQQEFTFIDSLQKFYNDVIQKSDPVFTEKDIKIKWANFNFEILQGTAYPRKHWNYLTDEEKNILFCLTRNKGNTPWIDAYKKSKEMLSLLNTQPCNEKEKENIRNLIAAEQTYKASTESRVIGPVLILKMDNLSEDDSEIDLITKIIKNHAEYFNVTSHEISNYNIDIEACRRLVNAFANHSDVSSDIKKKLENIQKSFDNPKNIKIIQTIIFHCNIEKILNEIPEEKITAHPFYKTIAAASIAINHPKIFEKSPFTEEDQNEFEVIKKKPYDVIRWIIENPDSANLSRRILESVVSDNHYSEILKLIFRLKPISTNEDLGAIIQKIEKTKDKNDSLQLALIINKKKHGFIIENWNNLENVISSLEKKLTSLAKEGEHKKLNDLIDEIISQKNENTLHPNQDSINDIISTLEKINPRTESPYHELLKKILNSSIPIHNKKIICDAITNGRNQAIKEKAFNPFQSSTTYNTFSEELAKLSKNEHKVLISTKKSTDRSQNNSRAFSTTDSRSRSIVYEEIPKFHNENTSLTERPSELDVPDYRYTMINNPDEEKSWWTKLNFLTKFWEFFNKLLSTSDKKVVNNNAPKHIEKENPSSVKSCVGKLFSFFSQENGETQRDSVALTEACSTRDNSPTSSLNSQ